MSIDPKKIAEWKRRAAQDVADGPRGDDWPPHVVVALLAEREEMLALLRDCLKTATEFEGFCPGCLGFGGSPDTVKHEPGCRLAAFLKEA